MLGCLYVSTQGFASADADGLTINVVYVSGSLRATLSNGTGLNSGAVVPPGPYSVVVYDSGDDPAPQFMMTGPDASISSDLDPTGMGIEVPVTFGPFVFGPSASYSIYDAGLGSGSAIAFSTSATGSSASAGASTTVSTGASSGSSAIGAAKTLGTLVLSVGASGRPSLTLDAKPVKTIKHGRYELIVGDNSKKAGLLLGRGAAQPSTLSGAAAVGTSLRTMTVASGRWYFEPSRAGPKSYFTVT
jgi:hypothetical protein